MAVKISMYFIIVQILIFSGGLILSELDYRSAILTAVVPVLRPFKGLPVLNHNVDYVHIFCSFPQGSSC